MNSDKRMAELYLERDAGKKHTNCGILKTHGDFQSDCEYKLKPETLEEVIEKLTHRDNTTMGQDMRDLAKWAWANPGSKE